MGRVISEKTMQALSEVARCLGAESITVCDADRFTRLGIEPGTCEGCYERPCSCLPNDANCDPNE
jgi:hypothetical protein